MIQADVLIVGGGAVGSAIAYFLAASQDFHGSIVVAEKDPTYARCSTSLSVGGVRQQFSTPENIQMSLFGTRFFREVGEVLAHGDEAPDVSFTESGYLFLSSRAGLEALAENHRTQTALGAEVTLLTPRELEKRFPWLNTSDLAAGSLGAGCEGWIDPHSLLMAFRGKARSLGATYLADEVTGIQTAGCRVVSVRLASGASIGVGSVVNAAGISAASVAHMAGIPDVPVRPRKRFVYRIRCREPLPHSPLTIDPSGVYFRPEGRDFLCGVSPPPERDPDCTDLRMEYGLFQEVVWPALAHRVPAFDAIRLLPSWAGHYAFNVLDQNAILGPHPDLENFYFANGFSGHGLQQSPAVGRAIAELIVHGGYRTLDLGRFSFERFSRGQLLLERSVV